jgi:hypothetical protein
VITETETIDPVELQSLLSEAGVLLIPEPEESSTSTLIDVGETLAQTLRSFLQAGGRIVSCAGGDDGGEVLLRGAGITTAESDSFFSSPEIKVVVPSDPLMNEPFKIPSSFKGRSTTFGFSSVDADAEILVRASTSGADPIVVRLKREGGEVILLGFDYDSYNNVMENLLLNACNYQVSGPECASCISTTGTLSGLSGTYDDQTCFKVSTVATMVGIAVEGEVNLYFRHGSAIEPTLDSVDYSIVSSGKQEMVISAESFRPGRWFVVVDNVKEQTQSYKLSVLPVPTLIEIEDPSAFSLSAKVENTPVSAVNRYLRTSQGMLSPEQYVVLVRPGMRSLLIRLNTDGKANLYLRYASPVEVANKRVVADIWATTAGGSATLSIAGDWLKSGTYYIAVEGTPPQSYEIETALK